MLNLPANAPKLGKFFEMIGPSKQFRVLFAFKNAAVAANF